MAVQGDVINMSERLEVAHDLLRGVGKGLHDVHKQAMEQFWWNRNKREMSFISGLGFQSTNHALLVGAADEGFDSCR